jgi:type IV pilus assembly protein PilQ
MVVALAGMLWGPVAADDHEPSYDDSLPPEHTQCRVTNVFYDTDLREVLHSMSSQCGVTIVSDESVMGIVTMELMDVPLGEALKRVLTPYGMAWRWMGDYYLVGAARPDNPSFPLLAESELYRPNYVHADDIPKLLSTFYEPYIRVNKETNTVTLYGSPQLLERLKADLAKVDAPPRKVNIEALVTEVSQDNLVEVGLDAWIDAREGDAKHAVATMPLGGVSDSSLSIIGTRMSDTWEDWTLDYEVALRALFLDGKVNVRANPQLSTVEGKPARIFVGKDEYHTIATGREPYVYSRLEVIKVGISLEITPYVAENGDISVDVKTSVSDVTGMGVTGLPVVSTREVTTRITVPEGESIVIGGLQDESERKSVKKLPLLGDIPILGYLFRSTSIDKRTTNIIIVITPTLITGESES